MEKRKERKKKRKRARENSETQDEMRRSGSRSNEVENLWDICGKIKTADYFLFNELFSEYVGRTQARMLRRDTIAGGKGIRHQSQKSDNAEDKNGNKKRT